MIRTTTASTAESSPAATEPSAPATELPNAETGTSSGQVDYGQHWDSLWSSVSGSYPGLPETMALAGTAVVVVFMLKWLMDSRKSRDTGKAARPMLWMLIPGAALLAPTTIIPMLLHVVSLIVNVAAGALTNVLG